MSASGPTALSVFTGLGGLDLGLEAAGYRTVGCIEIDQTARRSLKTNRPEWPVLDPGDIQLVAPALDPKQFDMEASELGLLAGGPPCQPYSKAAMWNHNAWNGLQDSRATPLHSFLVLVERFLPEAVLIENVPGFARGRHSALPTIDQALSAINSRAGTAYHCHHLILRADHYGIPQRRQRAILMALRDGSEPRWPSPTHADAPCRAWDALHDLEDTSDPPRMMGKWADLLPSIPEGSNYLWHTSRGGGQPLFGYRTRYWSFLLKLAKAEPAWTVPAQPGPASGPFHWENRPLRTSEMLRLQTFPSDWVVEGGRREQVVQVGNATPPLLAELLGRSLLVPDRVREAERPPIYGIPAASDVPPPEATSKIAAKYLDLIGEHPDHPGSGKGPNPRAETDGDSGDTNRD